MRIKVRTVGLEVFYGYAEMMAVLGVTEEDCEGGPGGERGARTGFYA